MFISFQRYWEKKNGSIKMNNLVSLNYPWSDVKGDTIFIKV